MIARVGVGVSTHSSPTDISRWMPYPAILDAPRGNATLLPPAGKRLPAGSVGPIKKQRPIAEVGVVAGIAMICCGVTLTSMTNGAQSAQYYAVIILGLLCLTPNAIVSIQRPVWFRAALVTSLAIAIYGFQLLAGDWYYYNRPALLDTVAISAVIAIAASCGFVSDKSYQDGMSVTALVHLGICIYALGEGHFSIGQPDIGRFSTSHIATAAWAEIALGSWIAAILSQRMMLIAALSLVSAALIFVTQMRGAGLAMIIGMVVYSYSRVPIKYRTYVILAAATTGAITVAFYLRSVFSVINEILLLNDPYRGLSSGFSGRFGNISAGIQRFLDSPVIGVGVGDPIISYTHCGYIKAIGELGTLFGLIMGYVLLVGLSRARRVARPELVCAIISYIVFITSAPRYINFQLMPFVSITAVAHSHFLFNSESRRRSRQHR